MKPSAIQVAIDILRELGREEEARWIEHPEAVRTLLKVSPFGDGETCEACECDAAEAHQTNWIATSNPESRVHCAIAEAWRALGDPRGAEDVERAHEEALRVCADLERGVIPPGVAVSLGPFTLSPFPLGRIHQVEALLADGLITPESAAELLK